MENRDNYTEQMNKTTQAATAARLAALGFTLTTVRELYAQPDSARAAYVRIDYNNVLWHSAIVPLSRANLVLTMASSRRQALLPERFIDLADFLYTETWIDSPKSLRRGMEIWVESQLLRSKFALLDVAVLAAVDAALSGYCMVSNA